VGGGAATRVSSYRLLSESKRERYGPVERRIRERYNDTILREAMRRYGIAQDQIRPLDGFESFVYMFSRGPETYILRIAHSLRRSEALIRGEVDWINYLARGGASTARALPSMDGNLVELIDDTDGGHFLTTAFVEAKGRPPWEVGWTPELFEAYGRLLGRMHALSKRYEPANAAWKRPDFDDPLMQEIERNLPATQATAIETYRALMVHVRALPRDSESYGLIHYDAHAANLHVDKTGRITLFDFDDCAYAWFAYDIAIVLFYMVIGESNPLAFAQEFMAHFLRGYRQENRLDPRWLEEIPYFLKHREIDLYGVIHRSFDVDHIDDPWCVRYMDGRKERIERDIPYLDFDFQSLAAYL
jgi:Ser/Thr protein kinase RdoA (MazF antagonist)